MGNAALDVAPVSFSVNAQASPSVSVVSSSGAQVILVPVPGAQGPAGPAGNGTQVFNETPTGTVDGSNAVFTTAHAFQPGSTAVYINGLRERLGVGYTETTSTSLTFSQPPTSGDELIIDYLMQ